MRTLTETLMEEEARHNSDLGYKTASSYMFGAEMSSGFGSARGGGSGFGSALDFGMGGGGIARSIPDTPFIERYRLDTSHGYPHLNFELGIKTSTSRIPLITKHIKLW